MRCNIRFKPGEEKMMKKIFLFVAIFLSLMIPASLAHAGVSVLGGLMREMNLNPGGNFEGIVELRNSGDEMVHIKVFQTDYTFKANGRTTYGIPGSVPRSNASWISFNPSRITILPEDTAALYFEVNVPDDLELTGTYWSVIMIEPECNNELPTIEGEDGKAVLGVKTVIRYAVQIITNVGSTGESNVRMIDHTIIERDGKTFLQADIENVGECCLAPATWIELYDQSGKYVNRFESDQQRIYPSCSVRHYLDLSDVPGGLYTGLFIIDNGDERVFGANCEVRIEQ